MSLINWCVAGMRRSRRGADTSVLTVIRVTAFDAEMAHDTYFQFWLNPDSSDPGPEYMTEVFPDSGRSTLQRVDDLAGAGTTIKCDG